MKNLSFLALYIAGFFLIMNTQDIYAQFWKETFAISAWWSPRMTRDITTDENRLKEFYEANFNVVNYSVRAYTTRTWDKFGNSQNGPDKANPNAVSNKYILERIKAVNRSYGTNVLQALIPDVDLWYQRSSGVPSVNDLRNYTKMGNDNGLRNAFLGYLIWDEPNQANTTQAIAIQNAIKKADKNKLRYFLNQV